MRARQAKKIVNGYYRTDRSCRMPRIFIWEPWPLETKRIALTAWRKRVMKQFVGPR